MFCQLVIEGVKCCGLGGGDIDRIEWNTRGGRGYVKVVMRDAGCEKNVLEFFRTRGQLVFLLG